jgi:hypothetical protein
MSNDRSGEKTGWVGGWYGAFLWVFMLSVIFLLYSKTLEGVIGLVILADAVAMIHIMSPWRRPAVKYWILMVPLYVSLALSICWVIWAFRDSVDKFNPFNLSWVVVLILPLITMGKRRWVDG